MTGPDARPERTAKVRVEVDARQWLRCQLEVDYRRPGLMAWTGWAFFMSLMLAVSVATGSLAKAPASSFLLYVAVVVAAGRTPFRRWNHRVESHAASPYGAGLVEVLVDDWGARARGSAGDELAIAWAAHPDVYDLTHHVAIIDRDERTLIIPKAGLDEAALTVVLGQALVAKCVRPNRKVVRWGLFLLWPLLVALLLAVWHGLAPPSGH
ncbi:MAG: hypothetical protein R3B72_19640 [Polyangiaceae bacterium]